MDFDNYANAQEHSEEIRTSRIGGLGGSDAKMVLKVGRDGTDSLSNTDLRRLAVMTGQAEPDNFGGNDYTNAGHQFEDVVANELPSDVVREYRMELADKPSNIKFGVFAHADFFDINNGIVYECKFVQKPTEKVIETYYAQLQWYYMLGAESVVLVHGTGPATAFDVQTIDTKTIDRDDDAIEYLRRGLDEIAKFIKGWMYDERVSMSYDDCQLDVQQLADRVALLAETKADISAQYDKAVEELKDTMELLGYANIKREKGEDYAGFTASVSRASKSRTFDSKKLLKAHPELDLPEYYKESARKASLTFKFNK